MPFFSVVISLYNKEKFIENTLKSVLNQTFTDYEIIIINDGSTDQSEALVLKFKDTRIHYYYQKNAGASAARNLGIEKANAPFIAFLDGDDLWFDNHLSNLKLLIDSFPNAGIYASRYQLIFKNNSVYVPDFKNIKPDYSGIVTDYFEASLYSSLATSSSIAVPKAVFKEIGLFNPTISSGQDTDMWMRIALKKTVVIGNKVTASYLHFVENSLSKTAILDKKIKNFEFYKEYENQNSSLKKFLDLYRLEYALQYKMVRQKKIARNLYQEINLRNIPLKGRILFNTPYPFLIILKKIKLFLRNRGIDFSIYK